jgi:hypothetical protein
VRTTGCVLVLALFCLLAIPAPAHAYLDPGTGSLILQGLVAAFAGAVLALKLYWSRIKAFFSGANRGVEGDEGGADRVRDPTEP